MTTPALGSLRALIRLDLRLERWRIAAWVLALSLTQPLVYRSYTSMFSSSAQRSSLSKAFGSSASLTVIAGPARGLTTIGGLTSWKTLMFSAVLAAIMAITTVVRRTRADEEAGRTELLGSTALSPATGLGAGVALGLAASLGVAGLGALGLLAVGSPAAGAISLGVAIGGAGLVFVGVAAVAAQVAVTARGATSLALVVLGAAFAVRAVGDTTSVHWLDWSSPLGWSEEVAPYAGDHLWVLGIFAVVAVALCGLAGALLRRRDVGSGMLPERPGPARAGRHLTSAAGLARRLDLRWLVVWSIGLTAFGAVVGSVTTSLVALAKGSSVLARFLGPGHGTVTDLFLAQMLGMLSVLAAAAGVQAVLRARSEEQAGRAEELLATGLSRTRFLGSHVVLGLLGSAVVLTMGGLALGATAAASGATVSPASLLAGIGVQLVPCSVLVALAIALVGAVPRLSVLALPVVVGTYFLTSFGNLLRLPAWAMDLSAYTHVPTVPGGTGDLGALIAQAAACGALLALGLVAMGRRDLG